MRFYLPVQNEAAGAGAFGSGRPGPCSIGPALRCTLHRYMPHISSFITYLGGGRATRKIQKVPYIKKRGVPS